jgi:hypothetical protein
MCCRKPPDAYLNKWQEVHTPNSLLGHLTVEQPYFDGDLLIKPCEI